MGSLRKKHSGTFKSKVVIATFLSDKRSQKERNLEKENKILREKSLEQIIEFEWL